MRMNRFAKNKQDATVRRDWKVIDVDAQSVAHDADTYQQRLDVIAITVRFIHDAFQSSVANGYCFDAINEQLDILRELSGTYMQEIEAMKKAAPANAVVETAAKNELQDDYTPSRGGAQG